MFQGVHDIIAGMTLLAASSIEATIDPAECSSLALAFSVPLCLCGHPLLVAVRLERKGLGMNFLQDLRFSFRTLVKSPAFALVAVASLALGIGANTTIFSLVNAMFLNPLPVEKSAELVAVYTVDETNAALGLTQLSYPNYEDYRDENEVFDGTFAWGFPVPGEHARGRRAGASLYRDGDGKLLRCARSRAGARAVHPS
jgi:hypothetical protein